MNKSNRKYGRNTNLAQPDKIIIAGIPVRSRVGADKRAFTNVRIGVIKNGSQKYKEKVKYAV